MALLSWDLGPGTSDVVEQKPTAARKLQGAVIRADQEQAQSRPFLRAAKITILLASGLSVPRAGEASLQKTFGTQQLMDRLPQEVRIAICRDALLMLMLEGQLQRIRGWAGPIFRVWMKIVYYERQWPGSTEPDGLETPVPWDGQ